MRLLLNKIILVITALSVLLIAEVSAAKSKPDVTTTGLKLDRITLKDGEARTVKADAASFHANGRCMFDTSYVTANQGKAVISKKSVNILKRNDKLVRRNAIKKLKAGEKQEHKFLLSLETGDNHLVLTLDNSNSIDESNEKNNKISANLRIVGKCSGKFRDKKKKAKK